ncbi:MAG: hypothetical protein Q8R79_05200 [Legionellaceae bacterium]|nr:hypothetical protein [Legionellaceae bacterium]
MLNGLKNLSVGKKHIVPKKAWTVACAVHASVASNHWLTLTGADQNVVTGMSRNGKTAAPKTTAERAMKKKPVKTEETEHA